MSEELRNYKPSYSNKLNILLFGYSGHGKSSTIKNCITHFKSRISQEPAVREDEDEQVTVEFKPYKITKNIIMWDTWGFSPSLKNYSDDMFTKMISGVVEEDTSMGDKVNTFSVIDENIQHRIIFVVDYGIDENDLEKFKPFVEKAIVLNIPFVFAVTKVDELIGKEVEKLYKEPLSKVGSYLDKPIGKLSEKLKKIMGSRTIRIIPIINYSHNSTFKKTLIDDCARFLLETVIFDSERSVKSSSKKFTIDEKFIKQCLFQNEKRVELKQSF